MRKTRVIRKISFGMLLLSATLLAGCGGGINGTYKSSNGLMSIKFESGKAYVTLPGGTVEAAYEVDGDKVILKNPQGNLVLTREKNGSLDGPMGTMTKAG